MRKMGGSLDEQDMMTILNMCGYTKDEVRFFIETGTYKGDTSRAACKVFDTVCTVEIVQELYEESAQKSFKEGAPVHHYLGDSVRVIPAIIERHNIHQPSFWYLDAHQSGADTSNNGTYVPLIDEINTILTHITDKRGIYVIDDLRLFTHYDWESISLRTICDTFSLKVEPTILKRFIWNDRFIVAI